MKLIAVLFGTFCTFYFALKFYILNLQCFCRIYSLVLFFISTHSFDVGYSTHFVADVSATSEEQQNVRGWLMSLGVSEYSTNIVSVLSSLKLHCRT